MEEEREEGKAEDGKRDEEEEGDSKAEEGGREEEERGGRRDILDDEQLYR